MIIADGLTLVIGDTETPPEPNSWVLGTMFMSKSGKLMILAPSSSQQPGVDREWISPQTQAAAIKIPAQSFSTCMPSGALVDIPPSRDQVAPAVGTTFDFRDGNGPVPAHKHENGGGWVADTAHVSPESYVGPYARVYGHALVTDRSCVDDAARVFDWAGVHASCICDRSIVYDHAGVESGARIENDARVHGYARVSGPMTAVRDDACVRGFSRISSGVFVVGKQDINEPEPTTADEDEEEDNTMPEVQQESKMSKVATELKANAKSAALRVAATQAVRAAREVFIATAFKTIPKKERKVRSSIAAILRSEWGEPIIASLLSLAIIATNPAAGSKRAILAAELRVMAMAGAANEAIANVAGPIFAMFAKGGALDAIVEQLPGPDESVYEEKTRAAETVAVK